jgi:intein-encoded DNA endonuclease-like protein
MDYAMSALKRLVEERLGQDINKWIRARQKQGVAYRAMAEQIHEETGIEVSKSSLHLWATK